MQNTITTTLSLLLLATAVNAQVNFTKQPQWNEMLTKAKAENKYIFMDDCRIIGYIHVRNND